MLQKLLKLVQRNNHPLLRQYVSTITCRVYICMRNEYRKVLVGMLDDIDMNVGVPILLVLGYELVECGEGSLLETLLKFISCHSAYLRTICQYYVKKHVQQTNEGDRTLN